MAGGGVNVAIFPTPAAIEAAWDRYSRLMKAVIDHPELSVNLTHMQDVARAYKAWQDAFLAGEKP
jgi:hypothetical protein